MGINEVEGAGVVTPISIVVGAGVVVESGTVVVYAGVVSLYLHTIDPIELSQ